MSTIVEPVVARDEKSKFFIFFPEIAYGKPRNVVWFFSWNIFLNPLKNQKSVTVPSLVKNKQNSVTNSLS